VVFLQAATYLDYDLAQTNWAQAGAKPSVTMPD